MSINPTARLPFGPVASVLSLVLVASACGFGAPAGEPGAGEAPDGSSVSDPTPSPTEADRLRVSAVGWSTDFSRHSVPLGEIFSGGPRKDGIPALDSPTFEPVAAVDWLDEVEPVIAFRIGDAWRAYPIQILMWHEIVNDVVAGIPVAITFCPLCHTAIAFDRRLGARTLDFGTTGNLRHSDLVMYDRQTETWWQQATGFGIVGTLTDESLEILPSTLTSWSAFRAAHPQGDVLSRETGFARPYGENPYIGYDRVNIEPFLLRDKTLIDGRLSPKVRILGLLVDDESAAYPFPLLAEANLVNDTVGGEPVIIVWAAGTASGMGASTVAGGDDVGAAAAYSRDLNGRTLTFVLGDGGEFRDIETGTTWNFDGLGTAGPLTGRQLRLLVSDTPFWFAWAIFRPDTRIWIP